MDRLADYAASRSTEIPTRVGMDRRPSSTAGVLGDPHARGDGPGSR